MNDEENKAIDNFKKLDFFEYDWQFEDEDFETREDMLSYAEKMQKIILNLINSQQKEIEDLKETNNDNAEKSLLNDIFIKNNYISKDKIRAKIKIYDKWIKEGGDYTESLEAQRYALEELLEEN